MMSVNGVLLLTDQQVYCIVGDMSLGIGLGLGFLLAGALVVTLCVYQQMGDSTRGKKMA